MRIISQDSQIDLPYNRIMLCVEGVLVTAINDGKQYLIGKYHTEEKAINAMKMCREQYSRCEFNKLVIPKTDENLAKVSISLTGNAVNQIAEKYVFQFPADEEI